MDGEEAIEGGKGREIWLYSRSRRLEGGGLGKRL